MEPAQPQLHQFIDHTLLKPEAREVDIRRLCQEALQFDFFGVCVNSSFVSLAARELSSARPRVISVVGFPLGAMMTRAKAFEAELALAAGAHEIDMVLPIGALKDGNYSRVKSDIRDVAEVCQNHILKVILETGLLTEEEKRVACELSVEAGANFVKTCTGFAKGQAEVADILFMRQIVGPQIGVKASGGIKTPEQAQRFIEAGANRLGTSSGPALIGAVKGTSDGY